MKWILKKVFLVGLVILLCNTFFSSSSFAMEAAEEAVAGAAERAFGEEAVDQLAGGAIRDATENIATEMGVSAEDIGNLPEAAKDEFVAEVADEFGEDIESVFKDGKFAPDEQFGSKMQSAKEGFNKELSQLGETQGFSPLEADAASKFDPEITAKKFPTKTLEEQRAFRANQQEGFVAKEDPLSPAEEKVAKAEKDLAAAQRDVDYLRKIGDPEGKLAAAESKVGNLTKEFESAQKELGGELQGKIKADEGSLGKADAAVKEKPTAENIADKQDAENNLQDSQGKERIKERKSALRKYEEAKQAKEGTPEKTAKEKSEELKQANDEVRAKQKVYDEAEAEEPPDKEKIAKADEELKAAKAKQELAREKAGTKIRKEVAQKEAKAKLEGAQQELKDAAEADRVADQRILDKEKALYESGQGDWKFNLKQRAINTYESLKDQIVMGVIGGFAFSLPNFIIGPIEAAMNAKAQRDTMEKPQLFGNVWMQIPSPLISKPGEPLVAKYLYVAVPNAKSTDDHVKRSHEASTDSYLQHAPMYMSRSEYDVYAEDPIISPRFPGQMVHLNTGFQFLGNGEPVAEAPRIQFLGEPPKEFRGEPLQEHLNRQSVEVRRGIAGDQYFEEREQPTKYKGSPTIADQFDPDKNEAMETLYPEEAKEDKGYGSVLNNSIQAFANGTYFGPLKVQEFNTISEAAQKELGITPKQVAHAKPWVAYGQYVYQTADTQNVKAVRAILQRDPQMAGIANEIVEYVVMLDDENKVVPLQMPDAAGNQYGIAGYQRNRQAISMVSLMSTPEKTYPSYNDAGVRKQYTGSIAIKLDDDVATQIGAMNKYINEKAQLGSFNIGGKKLEPNKDLIDAGVYVYKIAGALEGGADDYVVTTLGFNVIPVTQTPQFIISLVTSRIYDDQMVPWDNPHGKRRDSSYIIYKQKDEAAPPLVVVGSKPNPDYGTPISTGLKVPLYSLFMDPDINPNTVDPKSIQNEEDRKRYAQKVGVKEADESYPIAVPDQWALGDRGPVANPKTNQRIGQLIEQKKTEVDAVNTLRKSIDAAYQTWKKLSPKAVSDDLGPFIFADIDPRPIILYATSGQDIENKNFVYTSANYPDEYLILSDSPDSSGAKFATQYDIAEPQRYAISISSGNVYDSQKPAEPISQIDNLDQLLKKVTNKQGKFLPTLLKEIQGTQSIHKQKKEQEQYSDKTFFGPFKLYIDATDLNAGQYIYADMTKFGNPLKMDAKTLQEALSKADYFVGISLIDEKGDVSDPTNWQYGTQIGPKTVRVLNLITGILYDRGGGYQGYMKEFSDTLADPNLNLQTGYLTIWKLLEATWGKSIRKDLQTRINKLTQAEYDKLLAEKKEIAKAEEEYAKLYDSLDKIEANLRKNLDGAKYVPLLQSFEPKRYVKKYNNKYYTVLPADPGPKTYIDYNVGVAGKDNGVGMSYDADGNALVRMTGWVLDNARAYAGVMVKPDGSQEIDVAVDHPAIPMEGMVKLDEAALEKKLADARAAYQKAAQAANKKPDDESLTNALAQASMDLGYARLEHEAAQVAALIIKNLKKENLYANYTFYFNEQAGTYFIGIPEGTGQRFIDLKAGYEFNNDGSPRLNKSSVFVNKKDATDLLLVGREAYDLFIAVFKGLDKKYYTWTVNDIQKEETKTGFDYNYFVANTEGDSGNVYWYPDQKNYRVFVTPIVATEAVFTGSYQKEPNKEFSLLRYFRTQGANGGSYVEDDATMLSPVFIIWDGKPDLKLQQLYYRNTIITLSGKGDTFTGQYKTNGETRSITLKKVVKPIGKLGKAHYITITDGKTTYDLLYDTSILNPQLPTSCDASTLMEQKEEIQKLNYWKQCPNGWNLNVVSDSNGILRLAMGLSEGALRVPQMTDALKKQAGKRAEILANNVKLIRYDRATNRYVYKLSKRDSKWAYYQPRWDGWYVNLADGILYGINPASGVNYYPLGSMQLSQLYVLLDKLEVSIGNVQAADGEPLYDNQGKPIIDPKTKQQIVGKPGIVYRAPSVINTEIKNLATTAQAQQAVGR